MVRSGTDQFSIFPAQASSHTLATMIELPSGRLELAARRPIAFGAKCLLDALSRMAARERGGV